MFEAKRTSKALEFKLGDEIIKVHLGGLFQYKKFADADQKLNKLLNDAKSAQDKSNIYEFEKYLGLAIMDEMECIFGKDNAQKILTFYEDNYDEMFTSLLPFIKGEYIPAMLENIKQVSKSALEKYK